MRPPRYYKEKFIYDWMLLWPLELRSIASWAAGFLIAISDSGSSDHIILHFNLCRKCDEQRNSILNILISRYLYEFNVYISLFSWWKINWEKHCDLVFINFEGNYLNYSSWYPEMFSTFFQKVKYFHVHSKGNKKSFQFTYCTLSIFYENWWEIVIGTKILSFILWERSKYIVLVDYVFVLLFLFN